jgi:hypothetical protein
MILMLMFLRYCVEGECKVVVINANSKRTSGCCVVHDSRARDGACERRNSVELSLPVS